MAKAIGDPQGSLRQHPAEASAAIAELVGRLEALAVVNVETRSTVFAALEAGDAPDYGSAYEALFVAVAMLDPGHASQIVSDLVGRATDLGL